MDSRIRAAVLGITRTILHLPSLDGSSSLVLPYKISSIWETGTPAQMLIRSFPLRASRMPFSERMPETIWGLHPRRTTSADWTPSRFWFSRILREEVRWERSDFIREADWGRRIQAMKWVGIRLGWGASVGVEIPEAEDMKEEGLAESEESEERMPERIAIPRLPKHLVLDVVTI